MRRLFLLLSACLLSMQPVLAGSPVADMIVSGAPIYTVDGCRTWAESMAVKDGKIIFVGQESAARAFEGPATDHLKLHDGMILPGFHDCHVHPLESGIELGHCTLDGCESRKALFERIGSYAKEHAGDSWIVGSGWSLPLFPDANPQSADLDAIIPRQPACFISQDGHSAWVNSQALKLASIEKSTPEPPLGKIERDASGTPSGTLRESAIELVTSRQPKPTAKERLEGLIAALRLANRFGITSMQDANAGESYLQTYREAEQQGKLTCRMVTALHVDAQKGADQVDELRRLRERYTSTLVKPTSAKIFADGVIESHTAALLQPYTDKPDTSGVLNYSPPALQSIVEALDRAGFQVHVHSICDRAVSVALDSFEHCLTVNGRNDNRHQIAHLELIQPTDLPRFRKLGVVANFQAYWAFNDSYISQCTAPLLGPERSQRLYQIRSMLNTGAVIAAGSDWSVSSLNPLDAIQVAVTRLGLEDERSQPWLPAERVSLPDMLAAYTINGAYDNHEEKWTGSLECGKAADFIVLDKNLFDLSLHDIHKAKVLRTYLNGKLVYRNQ